MASSSLLASTAISSSSLLLPNEMKAVASQGVAALPAQPPLRRLSIKASSASNEKTNSKNMALSLAAVALAGGLILSAAGKADASLVDDLLAKSAANKELNDKKRLTTSGANVARAYTVTFGTCKFPENFTGCQDLAKSKNVKFLTEDLKLECEGKDKYKCGSNVFWKW
ncbi:hypothetical protein O6H91_Y410800 [Diphasiastrum complanatum]|nr:hypothetical protein O6H91_Y410800 [Diphasiastrum complanatum]